MKKGVKLRLTIHNILYEIHYHGKKLNDPDIKKKIDQNSKQDISFIINVCLNSMRYYFHSKKIIDQYVVKKLKRHDKIIFLSGITQLVFLEFKEYAVIDSTVEISKKLNIYHGFINAVLKKINKDKNFLKNTKINFDDLPEWFVKINSNLSKREKNIFLNNFNKEPSQHIVFKNEKCLKNFELELVKSSDISGFVKNRKKIEEIPSFNNGSWWVQDFSSSFPLMNIKEKYLDGNVFDMCSAPGGKGFQVLSKNKNIALNDISKSRLVTLNENLKRLKFKPKVTNYDGLKLSTNETFDFIILDSPCSGVGTIRKNPEILFKQREPDLKKLLKIQKKLLDKASILLNKNGKILYMVCSFLNEEGVDQVENFLKRNNGFIREDFDLSRNYLNYKHLIKNNMMHTMPSSINGFNIDGYFAALIMKKN